MTRVKICGLKRIDDARIAVEGGADLLGFVFAASPRQIDPDTARALIAELRRDSNAKVVGVFVNASPDEMNRIAELCDLDYVQLSGSEPNEIVDALDVPAIRAIHVRDDESPEELAKRIAGSRGEILLLDTAKAGSWGGTGRTFDWDRVPPLDRPILLAGGLHADNVSQAIEKLQPWGVDVSSGVEQDGEKDAAKIRAFLAAIPPGRD